MECALGFTRRGGLRLGEGLMALLRSVLGVDVASGSAYWRHDGGWLRCWGCCNERDVVGGMRSTSRSVGLISARVNVTVPIQFPLASAGLPMSAVIFFNTPPIDSSDYVGRISHHGRRSRTAATSTA